MPNDRMCYVPGFIVYREYAIDNPHMPGEWDLTRDEHDCLTEEQAKAAVTSLQQEYPGDKVYYEAGNIRD